MIRLYESSENKFDTNGIGALSPVSCLVTEERNGEYELEMEYPITGEHYKEIQNRRIILAKPNVTDREQPFRIYKISRPMGGIVAVYARHISYDLSGIPLSPITAGSVTEALSKIQSASAIDNPFTFWSDKSTVANFMIDTPSSVRSNMGGKAGSLLDVYGGEYAYDRYTVRLYNQRGNDNGVTIRYGKNLTDLAQEENIESVYTGIYPFWKKEEEYFELPQKIVKAEGTFDFNRVMTLDLSSDFDNKPTAAELKSKAESYMKSNKIGVPKVSIKVSFIPLEQTEEYKNIAVLERVNLCDTVTVIFDKLGVNATAKCVKTVYNVLLERYDSLELGEAKTNIVDTIAQQQKIADEVLTTSDMQNAIAAATAWLTNGKGYMVARRDAFGNVIDLLFMDTNDINTAVEVMRVGQSGIGFSHNGVNGPYESAWTLDGRFNANFIVAGILSANLIKAGILKSANGKTEINMETGTAKLVGSLTTISEDGKFYGALAKDGINIYRQNELVGWFKGFKHERDGEVSWLKSDRIDSTSVDTKGLYLTEDAKGIYFTKSDGYRHLFAEIVGDVVLLRDIATITNINGITGSQNGFRISNTDAIVGGEDDLTISNVKSIAPGKNGSIKIGKVKQIDMETSSGGYVAIAASASGMKLHKVASIGIGDGNVGGEVAWKTVKLVDGSTASALCYNK